MKLNEITEKGLYAVDRRTIYQVFENDGKDFKEHPSKQTKDILNIIRNK